MADELGADDRLVAFMQYVRVLVVVLLTPLLVSPWPAAAAGGEAPSAAALADAARLAADAALIAPARRAGRASHRTCPRAR